MIGILGGSGLYELGGLEARREEHVETPFGAPSDAVVCGRMAGVEVAFLARHGRGHRLLPSEINYRANLHAFKQLGVERVLAISAVGSMREGITPGDVVLCDQFIDRTVRRTATYFGAGVVGHVSYADPTCDEWRQRVHQATRAVGYEDGGGGDRNAAGQPGQGARVFPTGTYLCMEGPQFSTRAESHMHRQFGVDVVGMTGATEAKLAREAELCFAILALSTDYDCWHSGHEAVTASAVIEVLGRNVARAQDVVRALAAAGPGQRTCGCSHAARHAIMTARDAIPAEAATRLQTLFGRYL